MKVRETWKLLGRSISLVDVWIAMTRSPFGPWSSAIVSALLIACGAGAYRSSIAAASEGRAWTPETSIAMRYVVRNPELETTTVNEWTFPPADNAVPISPDGKFLFFVTHHGDLATDATVSELYAFRIEDIRRALSVDDSDNRRASLAPLRKITFRSSSSTRAAIGSAKWSEDSSAIYFLGMSDSGTQQVFRLKVLSGELEQLTRYSRNAEEFLARGEGLAFKGTTREPRSVDQYPMVSLARRSDGTVISDPAYSKILWFSTLGRSPPEPLDCEWSSPVLSPDGRYAVLQRSHWDAVIGGSVTVDDFEAMPKWTSFTIKDLKHLRTFPMFRTTFSGDSLARNLAQPKALWSTNGEHLILVNTALPDGTPTPTQYGSRETYVISYAMQSGETQVLEPMIRIMGPDRPDALSIDVTDVEWLTTGQRLLVTHSLLGKESGGTVYTLERGTWVGRPAQSPSKVQPRAAAMRHGVSIELRQSANEPPVVIASNGSRELHLIPPDPAVQAVLLARQEPFEWEMGDGKKVVAGLTLPRDCVVGNRVPVVIQIYNYHPELFLPDGNNSSVDATQALAARGIAVLQIELPEGPSDASTEGAQFLERIESAIDALDRRGIVDRTRVGVTGFSRAGYGVLFSLGHPGKTRLAAAVCADSFVGDFASYITDTARGSPNEVYEKMNGGGSFWQKKDTWLANEVTFNVDKIVTPLLMTEHGQPPYSNHSLSILGAFLVNNKPLEYLYFPEGAHHLARPRERLASMETVVDWMAFWLLDYEDPTPEKMAQYERWRAMRGPNEK